MAKVYVSSTYRDLKECREQVRVLLRRFMHEDVAMEYYVAEENRAVDRCLADVSACDLYVSIFAWRYGRVHDDERVLPLLLDRAVKDSDRFVRGRKMSECSRYYLTLRGMLHWSLFVF